MKATLPCLFNWVKMNPGAGNAALERPTDPDVMVLSVQDAKRNALAVKHPEAVAQLPRLAQNYARSTINAHERPEDRLTVTLQAACIGDFAVCGIPFETIVEIGLDLKKSSPFPQTMIVGLANGRHGYLPTPEHQRLGGYETWIGTNQVQENVSVLITDQRLEMLTELRENP